MIKVEASVLIHRPLAEVFAILSNLENNMRWRTGMIAAEKISAGPIGVGTTYPVSLGGGLKVRQLLANMN